MALGETPSTAYPGDKGKANRDALNSMPTKLTSYLTPTTSTGELVKINYKYAAKDGLNYGEKIDICIKKIDYDKKKVKLAYY